MLVDEAHAPRLRGGAAHIDAAQQDVQAKVALLSDGKWWFDNEFHGKGVATSFPDVCP